MKKLTTKEVQRKTSTIFTELIMYPYLPEVAVFRYWQNDTLNTKYGITKDIIRCNIKVLSNKIYRCHFSYNYNLGLGATVWKWKL